MKPRQPLAVIDEDAALRRAQQKAPRGSRQEAGDRATILRLRQELTERSAVEGQHPSIESRNQKLWLTRGGQGRGAKALQWRRGQLTPHMKLAQEVSARVVFEQASGPGDIKVTVEFGRLRKEVGGAHPLETRVDRRQVS